MDATLVHSWARCKLRLVHVPLPQQRFAGFRTATRVTRLSSAAEASHSHGEYLRGGLIVPSFILIFICM